jgi:hypothetical protein
MKYLNLILFIPQIPAGFTSANNICQIWEKKLFTVAGFLCDQSGLDAYGHRLLEHCGRGF